MSDEKPNELFEELDKLAQEHVGREPVWEIDDIVERLRFKPYQDILRKLFGTKFSESTFEEKHKLFLDFGFNVIFEEEGSQFTFGFTFYPKGILIKSGSKDEAVKLVLLRKFPMINRAVTRAILRGYVEKPFWGMNDDKPETNSSEN